jgi:uncharacterized protein (TIGR00255 family)
MIKSMTGFGRGEYVEGVRAVTAEIRSVNHRYSEIAVRMPRRYAFAEDAVRRLVRERMARGKIDVTINMASEDETDICVNVNLAAARQYFKGFRELQKALDVTGDISLELLAGLPDVLKPGTEGIDEQVVTSAILGSVSAALTALNDMRVAEGSKLAEDIDDRIRLIELIVTEISKRAPLLAPIYAEKLKMRISELMEKADLPEVAEERFAMETAIFADKSNITEELVRLDSHLKQMRGILGLKGDRNKGGGGGTARDANASSEPVGKKMDFLLQEMNREANTIGSKANDLMITKQMLELKSEIEKIREQIQNIE